MPEGAGERGAGEPAAGRGGPGGAQSAQSARGGAGGAGGGAPGPPGAPGPEGGALWALCNALETHRSLALWVRRGGGSDSDRKLPEQMDEILLLAAGHTSRRRVT